MLCAANSYKQKYYFNEDFSRLPKAVQADVKQVCVDYAEHCGGIISLEFDGEGQLQIKTLADEGDFYFDEIESELLIRRLQKEKRELFMQLELFYAAVCVQKNK